MERSWSKPAHLRKRTGVHVLLMRRHGQRGDSQARVPSADDVIQEGDTLVVAGSTESLEQLKLKLASGASMVRRGAPTRDRARSSQSANSDAYPGQCNHTKNS